MKYEHSLLNPKNWTKKGKEKDKLDAHRHFYGESLDRALLDIEFDSKSDFMFKKKSLALDLKWQRLSEEVYDRKLNDLRFAEALNVSGEKEKLIVEKKYALSKIALDKKYGKIEAAEEAKLTATVNGEPYVTVVKVHYDETTPQDGYFELDYNDLFVEALIRAGYQGTTKELVVKQWFDTTCNNIARENGAVFPEQVEEFKHPRTGTRKVKSKDGKTEVL